MREQDRGVSRKVQKNTAYTVHITVYRVLQQHLTMFIISYIPVDEIKWPRLVTRDNVFAEFLHSSVDPVPIPALLIGSRSNKKS